MSEKSWMNPAPGRILDVNGLGMHLYQIGTDGPAVIMEAAIGDFCLTWSLVHNRIAQFARAITYDRAGLGWSDPSPSPRTGRIMVQELRRLLDSAGIAPPFLLVGHSFSALLARLFASTHTGESIGMVLLDPAHEDQFKRFPAPIREAFGPIRSAQIDLLRKTADALDHRGTGEISPVVVAPPSFGPTIASTYTAQSIADSSRVLTLVAELEGLEETQDQVRGLAPHSLAAVPITIISHGQPQSVPGMPQEVNLEYEDAWQQMQIEIAGLSRKGRRVVANQAGHMIHHEQPDLVVHEIRAMLAIP